MSIPQLSSKVGLHGETNQVYFEKGARRISFTVLASDPLKLDIHYMANKKFSYGNEYMYCSVGATNSAQYSCTSRMEKLTKEIKASGDDHIAFDLTKFFNGEPVGDNAENLAAQIAISEGYDPARIEKLVEKAFQNRK